MKKQIFILILSIFLLNGVYAVSNIVFNYEFNTSKSMVYSNIIKDDSIVLSVNTDISSLYCKYSQNKGTNFESMTGTFDFSFEQLHKKSFSYLDEGVHKIYVLCNNGSTVGQESELVFSIINPVKAEVHLSKNSPVNAGLLEITLKTTKDLSQKPTLSYSTDGSGYVSIPLTGSNDLWKGYLIISNDLKESIGSFKFRGIDLDGIIGEEITKGEIFLIDTEVPPLINEIDTEGRENDIYLEWRFNHDFSYFNIYRSKFANVEYTDFYKKADKKSFTDDDVEVGRAYYYRITAVDDAGNEGDLSYEVSSVALREDSITQSEESSGLDPELIGSVDSLLYDIEEFYNDAEDIKSDFNTAENQQVIDILGLKSEIDSSLREIESLNDEVLAFKNQKISRVELDKKLSNARTRIGVIKKNIPESLSFVSQTEYTKKYDENKIREILLSLSKTEDETSYLVKNSKEIMDRQTFEYKTKIMNVLIYYIDGSKKNKAIFIKEISFAGENNGSIIEFIPKEVAASSSEISFKDSRYNVLKDDPIVSFSADTKSIIYIIDKEVDLDFAKNSETFFLAEQEISSGNSITGMAILDSTLNSNSFVVIIILAISVTLVYFFFKSRKDKADMENLNYISDKLTEAKLYLETKNKNMLDEIYMDIKERYNTLSSKSKKEVYNKLISFHKQIKFLIIRR